MKKRISLLVILLVLAVAMVGGLLTACRPESTTVTPSGGGDETVTERRDLDADDALAVLAETVGFVEGAVDLPLVDNYLMVNLATDKLRIKRKDGTELLFEAEFYLKFLNDPNADAATVNEQSEMLFELRSVNPKAVMFGLYYDAGTFYLDFAGEKGANVFVKGLDFASILTTLASSVEGIGSTVGNLPEIIEGLNASMAESGIPIKIGDIVKTLLEDMFDEAYILTETTGEGENAHVKESLHVSFGLNEFLNTTLSTVNGLWGILQGIVGDIDGLLMAAFGVTFEDIATYRFEQIDLDLTVERENGVFSGMDVKFDYGNDSLGMDLQLNTLYLGDDPSRVFVEMPDFSGYEAFSLLNLDVSFALSFENGSSKNTTIGSALGRVLTALTGVEDLGGLTTASLRLAEGTLGLQAHLVTALDLADNKNSRLQLTLSTVESVNSGVEGDIAKVLYVGEEETLYIDLSGVGLPSLKYSLNLNNVLSGLLGPDILRLLGGSAAAAEGEVDPLADYMLTGTYGLAAAGEDEGGFSIGMIPDIVDLVKELLASRGQDENGRLTLTIDRNMLVDLLGMLGDMMGGELGAMMARLSEAIADRAYDAVHDLAFRGLTLSVGLVNEKTEESHQFGLSLGIEIALAEDTALRAELPLVALGFRPAFAPLDMAEEYTDLDRLEEVSFGATVALSFDSGGDENGLTLPLNEALGGLRDYIGELATLLRFEERIQAGVVVDVAGNLTVEPLSLSAILGGDGLSLHVLDMELALEIYGKKDYDEGLRSPLISVEYGRDDKGESALFVDLSAIDLGGVGALPRFRLNVDLEGMLNNMLVGAPAAAEETPEVDAPQEGEGMSPQELLSLVGGVLGGLSLGDGTLAVYLSSTVLDSICTLLIGEPISGMLTLDEQSRVYIEWTPALLVGLRLGLNTTGNVESNTSLALELGNLSLDLEKKDVLPEIDYGAYHDLQALTTLYVQTELFVRYDLDTASYDLSDLMGVVSKVMDVQEDSVGELLNELLLSVQVKDHVAGELRLKVQVNLDLANPDGILAGLEAHVEIATAENTLAEVWFDGRYLYVDASMGEIVGSQVRGMSILPFKILVNALPCGCKSEACIANGSCTTVDGTLCTDGSCTCCAVAPAGEEEELNLMELILANLGILQDVSVSSKGVSINLARDTLKRVLNILGVTLWDEEDLYTGGALSGFAPSLRLDWSEGLGLALQFNLFDGDADRGYVALGLDRVAFAFDKGDLGTPTPTDIKYGSLDLSGPMNVALSGELGLEIEKQDGTEEGSLQSLVQDLIGSFANGTFAPNVGVSEPVNVRLGFDLMANVNLARLDTADLVGSLPDLLSELHLLLKVYVMKDGVREDDCALMLYYDGMTDQVFARAPMLGIGAVCYKGLDLAGLIGGLLQEEDAAAAAEENKEESNAQKTASLVFNKDGLTVAVGGALIAEVLGLLGVDLGSLELGNYLESIGAGFGPSGAGINIGLAGVHLSLSVSGVHLAGGDASTLEKGAFAECASDEFVCISPEEGSDALLALNEISMSLSLGLDLSGTVKGAEEDPVGGLNILPTVNQLLKSFGVAENISALLNTLSVYLNLDVDLEVVLNLKVYANLRTMDAFGLALTLVGVDGDVQTHLMTVAYDYDGAASLDRLYVDLGDSEVLADAKKFYVDGLGIGGMLGELLSPIVEGLPIVAGAGEEESLDIMGLLNDMIASIDLNGKTGLIGITTTADFVSKVVALVGLGSLLEGLDLPDITADVALGLNDDGLAVKLGVTASEAEEELFHLGLGLGGFALSFSRPDDFLPLVADEFVPWTQMNVGFETKAAIEVTLTKEYAEKVNALLDEYVDGDHLRLDVTLPEDMADEGLHANIGLELAVNARLRDMDDMGLEIWLSLYFSGQNPLEYTDGTRLLTLYYNSLDEHLNEDGDPIVEESLYLLMGSAATSTGGVRIDDLGLCDMLLALLAPSEVATAMDAIVTVEGNEQEGLRLSANRGVVGLLLETLEVSGVLADVAGLVDGLEVAVGGQGSYVQLVLDRENEVPTSYVKVGLSDYGLMFVEDDEDLADHPRYAAAIENMRAGVADLMGLEQVYVAASLTLSASIAKDGTDEEGNSMGSLIAGYNDALKLILSSDVDSETYLGVDVEMALAGLDLSGLSLAALSGNDWRTAVSNIVKNMRLELLVTVNELSEVKDEAGNLVKDENGAVQVDKRPLMGIYYLSQVTDTMYVRIPALDMQVSMNNALDLQAIVSNLLTPPAAAAEEGVEVADILKLLDTLSLSNEGIALSLSTQVLSRVMALVGLDLNMVELSTLLAVGNLQNLVVQSGTGQDLGIHTNIQKGLGLHIGAVFADDLSVDVAAGDVVLAFNDSENAVSIYDDGVDGWKKDFFGKLDEYVSTDGMRANASFEVVLDFRSGATEGSVDSNVMNFSNILSEFVNTTFSIDIIDTLEGRYVLAIDAALNLAEGLDTLYGLQMVMVLYDETAGEREKLLALYYKPSATGGILGVDIEAIFGIEPFQLDMDLSGILGGLFANEAPAAAEDGTLIGEDTSLMALLNRLSGVIQIHVAQSGADENLQLTLSITGEVLQSALNFLGYQQYLPALAQGLTLKNTDKVGALLDGEYSVRILGERDGVAEEHVFVMSKHMANPVYVLNIGYRSISRMEIVRNDELVVALANTQEMANYFVIDRNASTISFDLAKEGARALPVGSYEVRVHYADGTKSALVMEKKVETVTIPDAELEGLVLTGVVLTHLESGVETVLSGDVAEGAPLPADWYGRYFAVNRRGSELNLAFSVTDGFNIGARVVLNDQTELTLGVQNLRISFGEEELVLPSQYKTNISFVTLSAMIELDLHAEEGTHVALSNLLGETLDGLLGTEIGGVLTPSEIPFGMWLDDNLDMHYLVSLQANLHFDPYGDIVLDLGGSDILLQVYKLENVGADEVRMGDLAFSVAYVGTEGDNGAVYLNLPYFDLKLKINEAPFKDVINGMVADLLGPSVAAAGEGGIDVGQILNLFTGLTLAPNGVKITMAADILSAALRLAGVDMNLADADTVNSFVAIYNFLADESKYELPSKSFLTEKNGVVNSTSALKFLEAKLTVFGDDASDEALAAAVLAVENAVGLDESAKAAWLAKAALVDPYRADGEEWKELAEAGLALLGEDPSHEAASAALLKLRERLEYVDLVIYKPSVAFDGELSYEVPKGQYTTITEAQMLYMKVQGSLSVESEGGVIELSQLASSNEDENVFDDVLNNVNDSKAKLTVDEGKQSFNFLLETNLGMDAEKLALLTSGDLDMRSLIMALVSDLTVYLNLSQSLDGTVRSVADVYYMNNYLYLDLSALGLPKVAMALSVEDIMGLVFGNTAAAAEPVDRATAFEIIWGGDRLILQAGTRFVSFLLDKFGYDLNADVSLEAQVSLAEGEDLLKLNLTAVDDMDRAIKLGVNLAHPELKLGGRMSHSVGETRDYAYLDNLEYLHASVTMEIAYSFNQAGLGDANNPAEYVLTSLFNDVFGTEEIPIVVENDIAKSFALTLSVNLCVKDFSRSEVYVALVDERGEIATVFYDGAASLYVSVPRIGDGLSLKLDYDIRPLLEKLGVNDALSDLNLQDMLYELLGLSAPAKAGEGEGENPNMVQAILSLIDTIRLSDRGAMSVVLNNNIFRNLGM
ncbi:MAG: hypothetical protein IJX70_06105, partial [Clostridia bacterium]|nr:hypothetical protein [Clostridia bacterium]